MEPSLNASWSSTTTRTKSRPYWRRGLTAKRLTRVLHAGDGEGGALAMTARHRPDLILLDIMMPKVGRPIEVWSTHQGPNAPSLRSPPIILVTAKSVFQ